MKSKYLSTATDTHHTLANSPSSAPDISLFRTLKFPEPAILLPASAHSNTTFPGMVPLLPHLSHILLILLGFNSDASPSLSSHKLLNNTSSQQLSFSAMSHPSLFSNLCWKLLEDWSGILSITVLLVHVTVPCIF